MPTTPTSGSGDLPAWRTLEQGGDDGADVRQLEQNLAARGYGEDLDVDESFTTDTAAAVEAWETDLGRAEPDGVVTIGEVVFLTDPGASSATRPRWATRSRPDRRS